MSLPALLLTVVQLAVSPGAVQPGGLVHVTGNAGACSRGSEIVAISSAFPGHAFGKGTLAGRVGAHGAFAIVGHVRAHVRPGRYAVTARCGGGNLGKTAFLRVR